MDAEHLDEVAAELQGRREALGGWGLAQLAASSALAVYAMWAALTPGFRRLPLRLQVPYVPSSTKQVENVMSLLKGRAGKMVDLGSGDGRIVLEAYKQGFRPAVGYELNPWLLTLSNYRAWRTGCYGKVFYQRQDLWKVNLCDCNNVSVFLAPSVMIFQHKDKGSTTIRFPLQLLGDCVIGEELNSRQQYIKGTSTSSQGVLTFKFIFLYGATDCLNMIQTLSSEDILREAANLQDYPTASIYTYAHPSAPRASRSLSTLPHWPPPYPGPPELPPPYSEVESTSPRERQEGCCRCRALRTQEQTDRQN
ncbi:adenine nucleotide translocase lysine N-methyltransferase [Pelodiscus sinensis]|uniref:adenine nucleotide translocase lysine N-methyltransferase n=1 Tax=Pelodiscus sinensis TaxID=13735 RepID=UPI003F6D4D56